MITATQLAVELQVSKAAISRAQKNGYNCNGLDISSIAVKDESNKVIGYNYKNSVTTTRIESEPLLTSELTYENEASEESNDSFECYNSEPITLEKEQKLPFFMAFSSKNEMQTPGVNENRLTTAKNSNTTKLATKSYVNRTAKSALTDDKLTAKTVFFGFIAVGLYRKFSPSVINWIRNFGEQPTLTANNADASGVQPINWSTFK
jgi:hypothetical protein